jgi:hypothetical protein
VRSGLHILLTSQEETALRRVAAGGGGSLPAAGDLERLWQLRLIDRVGSAWVLTPLGRQRYRALAKPLLQTTRPLADEIDRILGKYQTET